MLGNFSFLLVCYSYGVNLNLSLLTVETKIYRHHLTTMPLHTYMISCPVFTFQLVFLSYILPLTEPNLELFHVIEAPMSERCHQFDLT